MKYTDYNAHTDMKAQRIGKPDPNAWRHLQASRHVKPEPDAEADRAYLARLRRREMRSAIIGAAMTLAGWMAVIAVAIMFAVSIFGVPVTYSHVRVVAGEAYVLDHGLTAEDCSRVAQAASDDCVRE